MKLDESWNTSMKRTASFAFAFLLAAATAMTQEKQAIVRVQNPSKFDRPGEMVTVRWAEIKAQLPSLDPTRISVHEGALTSDLIFQVVRHAKEVTPDQLVFRSDFKAGEAKEFRITQSSEKHDFKSLTDARFVHPREDLAWENDRIAFRMYGPPLAKEGSNNGIDVWNKRVRSLIVEKWYEGEEQNPKISYHEDHGEGADYFSVGSSLGAGACALLKGDSLYQPGVFQKYRVIATGPLQAIFELTYNPVSYEGKKITEVMRITLSAGVNLNKIDVTFSGGSGRTTVSFAAGIVKRKGTTTSIDRKNGWVSLWGLTTDKEEIGYLGTGIVMPRATVKERREDTVHALIIGKVGLGKSVTYYAGAGWTLSGDFSSGADWNKYLSAFAQKIQSPLVVNVSAR
jgi:pectinesterase